MMSFYDLIQGEGHMSNCTAFYWSVFLILVSHMTIVLNDLIGVNRSHDLFHLPSSFQLNCLHQVAFFYANKIILDLKLFFNKSIGCPYPISHLIGIARGEYHPNWGY